VSVRFLNQIRTVLFIQVLNSFVSGVLGIALPLMMKARNIDVVLIGLVFACMPLVMQLGRMFFATISDFWGRKLFFLSNGVLGIVSGLIYFVANTPLEFSFGKVAEGTKEGTLWAVNRAFLLEKGEHWKVLVNLRTIVYVAFAVGSLLAGFLILQLLFEGTMLLCALIGILVILLSSLLVGDQKKTFSAQRALLFLDLRKKERVFKVFLILFLVMGLSLGLIGGFVITLFLDKNGFSADLIGLIVGVRILFAGLSSYIFSKTSRIKQLILMSGILSSVTFFSLGFVSPFVAGTLVIFYGVVEGISAIGQEGILSAISDKRSYGTDIGLLWMGFHVGESLSLAFAGFLIALWGFTAPFLLMASTYAIFYVPAYIFTKE